jgi:hypothetical protein
MKIKLDENFGLLGKSLLEADRIALAVSFIVRRKRDRSSARFSKETRIFYLAGTAIQW